MNMVLQKIYYNVHKYLLEQKLLHDKEYRCDIESEPDYNYIGDDTFALKIPVLECEFAGGKVLHYKKMFELENEYKHRLWYDHTTRSRFDKKWYEVWSYKESEDDIEHYVTIASHFSKMFLLDKNDDAFSLWSSGSKNPIMIIYDGEPLAIILPHSPVDEERTIKGR